MDKKFFSLLVMAILPYFLFSQSLKKISICSGNNVSLSAPAGANRTWQWQVKISGSNSFQNISNGTTYSGTNAATLNIAAPPTSFFGYQYRCLITEGGNTTAGDVNLLKFKAIWTGLADSLWNSTANWNCGTVPDENTEIVVQAGAAHYPYVNFNLTCKKLTLAPSSTLHILDGYKINISGTDTAGGTTPPQKFMVDSMQSVLVSTEPELAAGLFKYNSFPGYMNINEGDFLIEPRNFGYLRKVESVAVDVNGVSFRTSQGTISELYKDSGSISQTIIIPDDKNPFYRAAGKASNNEASPLSFSLPDFTAALGPIGSVEFSNLQVIFQPNPTVDFSIKNKYLKIGFEKAKYGFVYKAKVKMNLQDEKKIEIDLTDKAPFLKKLKIPFSFGTVFGHMEFNLGMIVSSKVSTAIDRTIDYSYIAKRDAYFVYANGVLTPVFKSYEPDYSFVVSQREWNLNGSVSVELELMPKIHIYSVPVANVGLSGNLAVNAATSLEHGFWDANASFGVGGKINSKKTLYSFLDDFEVTIPFFEPKKLWNAPAKIKLIGGHMQTGKINTKLPEPIRVEVRDSIFFTNLDFTLSNVSVEWASELGEWESVKTKTDADGIAFNYFTFGDTDEEHLVSATIKNAKNEVINTILFVLTPSRPPVVVTDPVSGISNRTVTYSGNVTDTATSDVIAKGICWKKNSIPSLTDNKTTNGTGLGSFSGSLQNLEQSTSYHLRAYAINSTDTAYGNEVVFKTDSLPALIGSWKLVTFANGVLPGDFVDELTVAGCPEIVRSKYTLLADNYSIDSTNFTNFNSERIINYLVTVGANCNILSSTTTDNTYNETYSGTYTVSGNTITYYIGDQSKSYGFSFLAPNLLSVAGNVYERQ